MRLAAPTTCIDALDALSERSVHPLVHARRWRARVDLARQAEDGEAVREAARHMRRVAQEHGLAEMVCEAMWCELRISHRNAESVRNLIEFADAGRFGWISAMLRREAAA